ncbi:MAG TPA: 4-hydroxy-tetrahydrodipicolinate reductase [Capsulimonadaceae bacterium]|nr:4-hydroxy-tetrahydrodipicolinate reductase [Capsulimonadaceae bacterium]
MPYPQDNLRVVVSGAKGRMGREVVKAVTEADGMEVAGEVDLGDDLAGVLETAKPDALVDFTVPAAALGNIRVALAAKVVPIVGTTGLEPPDLAEIRKLCRELGTGALIAPNFALGAVLMMQFAQTAARYFPDVEIIEMHHEKKIDSPSGTADLTAQMIASARKDSPSPAPAGAFEKFPGARGGLSAQSIRVHSVRLPGFVASQEVIFGGPGQRLTIRHDSIERGASFMPGVVHALRRVPDFASSGELIVGLENLL